MNGSIRYAFEVTKGEKNRSVRTYPADPKNEQKIPYMLSVSAF